MIKVTLFGVTCVRTNIANVAVTSLHYNSGYNDHRKNGYLLIGKQ